MNEDKNIILITGGTGFAGSHLVEYLLAQGETEIHVTSFSGKDGYVETLLGADKVHKLDITDMNATKALLEQVKPNQIYHLASFAYVGKSFELADEVLNNNVKLQLSLLSAIKSVVPEAKILVISSAEAYGVSVSESEIPYREDHLFRPINPYAVSKITQEMLAYAYHISYGLKVIRVRPFNHIGERQGTDFAVAAFARQIVEIENGKKPHLEVGSLEAIRDYSDVKDVVAAYHLVMQKGKFGEVYNIGSGQGVKMSTIVEKLIALSKVQVEVKQDQKRFRPHDVPKMIANNDTIKALGYNPKISLDESLQRIMEWYRREYSS